MVDKALLAVKVAAIRDAVARVRAVTPPDPKALADDRTAREVVVLNLFVALQECLDLATHWLADNGREVPQSYREVFLVLAKHDVISRDLGARLAQLRGSGTWWRTATASSTPFSSTVSRPTISVISRGSVPPSPRG